MFPGSQLPIKYFTTKSKVKSEDQLAKFYFSGFVSGVKKRVFLNFLCILHFQKTK